MKIILIAVILSISIYLSKTKLLNIQIEYLILLAILFVILTYDATSLEHLTNDEILANVASLYNNQNMKVTNLEVTGTLTAGNITSTGLGTFGNITSTGLGTFGNITSTGLGTFGNAVIGDAPGKWTGLGIKSDIDNNKLKCNSRGVLIKYDINAPITYSGFGNMEMSEYPTGSLKLLNRLYPSPAGVLDLGTRCDSKT